MGYYLTSLGDLAVEERIRLYFFLIGRSLLDGDVRDRIEDNFGRIGIAIGRNAAIVGGEQQFDEEVSRAYLGKPMAEISKLIPAMLVTDAHPGAIGDDSLCLLLPMNRIEERYSVFGEFVGDLVAYAKGENDCFLKQLADHPGRLVKFADIIDLQVPVVPGFVAIDLKKAASVFRTWRGRPVG